MVFSGKLTEPMRAEFRAALAAYAHASADEWTDLAQRTSSPEVVLNVPTNLLDTTTQRRCTPWVTTCKP